MVHLIFKPQKKKMTTIQYLRWILLSSTSFVHCMNVNMQFSFFFCSTFWCIARFFYRYYIFIFIERFVWEFSRIIILVLYISSLKYLKTHQTSWMHFISKTRSTSPSPVVNLLMIKDCQYHIELSNCILIKDYEGGVYLNFLRLRYTFTRIEFVVHIYRVSCLYIFGTMIDTDTVLCNSKIRYR